MLQFVSKLIEKLQINYLQRYIESKNPKCISDIERLEREYTRRTICG